MADKDKKIIDSTKNTLGEVFKEVRNISRNLLPYPLENTNLIPAIIALCERLSESKTVNIKFLTKIEKIDLKLSVQHALYRVIQELLSNTLRHSKATNIELTLMSDDKEISLQVNDNGTGIRKSLSKGGIGLENIKQRVKFIGGSLEINSILNEGTFVNILVPFDEFVN